MIPNEINGLRVVSWKDTKEEWFNKFEPYFEKANDGVSEINKGLEVAQREIRVYENHFTITTISRYDYKSYRFIINDGKLEYTGYEGDFLN